MKLKTRQNEMLRKQFELMVENEVKNRMRKISLRTTRQIKVNKNIIKEQQADNNLHNKKEQINLENNKQQW